jgi:hypothetical protein
MSEVQEQIIARYLEPTPLPPGTTSQELVRRAIEFDGPPRIPFSFVQPFESDFCEMVVVSALLGRPSGAGGRRSERIGEIYYDEWGVGQEVTGRGWDHAVDHPLADLGKLDAHRFPGVADAERFDPLRPYAPRARAAGKYCVGFDPVMMFERARSLVGFEELMIAPYEQPQGLEALLDQLADLAIGVIEQWARIGCVDGFMTWEDWGLQTTLQMKVETFREFYKPRYARIVAAAHERGMHYIWHNCGQILDMLPDMIEIGVDVVQLDQPRLMGHQRLADAFGGRICFWNTADIQWSPRADIADEQLHAEVCEMVRIFDRFGGGFMARQYPQPADIELSRQRHEVICRAFLESGCGLA